MILDVRCGTGAHQAAAGVEANFEQGGEYRLGAKRVDAMPFGQVTALAICKQNRAGRLCDPP